MDFSEDSTKSTVTYANICEFYYLQAQVTIAKPNVICTKTYVHKHATNY